MRVKIQVDEDKFAQVIGLPIVVDRLFERKLNSQALKTKFLAKSESIHGSNKGYYFLELWSQISCCLQKYITFVFCVISS